VQTQYFERPEGTLAYSDYGGSGELVLMLPGMGALRSEYRFLAPKLSEAGYRAVAADLRGHGESSVPWAAKVKAPTLVIMGTKDPDFADPVAEGTYIARQTGGKLELIAGAGHYPQTEMSEKTAPIVIEFLRKNGILGRAPE
jgi:pimeloyl-ACP methyl ester carboxylesterase